MLGTKFKQLSKFSPEPRSRLIYCGSI